MGRFRTRGQTPKDQPEFSVKTWPVLDVVGSAVGAEVLGPVGATDSTELSTGDGETLDPPDGDPENGLPNSTPTATATTSTPPTAIPTIAGVESP